MSKTISSQANQTSETTKVIKLFAGIILDLLGMVPSIFPPLAFLWAPLSGLILASMYKGKLGKFAAVFEFIEELVPIVDFVPTFTLTWFYVYVIKGGK